VKFSHSQAAELTLLKGISPHLTTKSVSRRCLSECCSSTQENNRYICAVQHCIVVLQPERVFQAPSKKTINDNVEFGHVICRRNFGPVMTRLASATSTGTSCPLAVRALPLTATSAKLSGLWCPILPTMGCQIHAGDAHLRSLSINRLAIYGVRAQLTLISIFFLFLTPISRTGHALLAHRAGADGMQADSGQALACPCCSLTLSLGLCFTR
jgi:hypothetical protein